MTEPRRGRRQGRQGRYPTPASIAAGSDLVVSRFDMGNRALLMLRLDNGSAAVAVAILETETKEVTAVIGTYRFRPERLAELDQAMQVFAKTLAPND